MKKTKNDGFEKSVDDLANLEKVVASRPGTIRFGPLLDGWPTPSHPYAFLSPDDRGVRACERVTHPGAQPLLGGVYDELCDLVLGGTNLIFELDPRRPAAVHFCETLLATLANSERCRAASHEPFVERLVRHTDWSIPDGVGPTTLPAPCVIGYTAASNIREAEVMQPAVLWSRRWLLSPDPVARLAKIMAKAIRLTGHCRSGKEKAPIGAPADWEAPLWRRISDMVLNSDKLTFGQIAGQIRLGIKSHAEEIRQTAMTDQSQVDATINSLLSRVKAAEREWTRCLRHPTTVMFDQAAPSFAKDEVLAMDCWGQPVGFTIKIGGGSVTVGCPAAGPKSGGDADGRDTAFVGRVQQTTLPPSADATPDALGDASPTHSSEHQSGRYVIRRGLNRWDLVFDGSKPTVLPDFLGVAYVAYLLKHPNAEPIYALDLINKVPRIREKQDGFSELVNPETGSLIPIYANARLQEANLNSSRWDTYKKLKSQYRDYQQVLADPSSNQMEREEAEFKLAELGPALKQRHPEVAKSENKAVRNVRREINRLVERLSQAEDDAGRPNKLLQSFGQHIRQCILAPSTSYAGKKPLIGSGGMAGRFVYKAPPGVCWTD